MTTAKKTYKIPILLFASQLPVEYQYSYVSKKTIQINDQTLVGAIASLQIAVGLPTKRDISNEKDETKNSEYFTEQAEN